MSVCVRAPPASLVASPRDKKVATDMRGRAHNNKEDHLDEEGDRPLLGRFVDDLSQSVFVMLFPILVAKWPIDGRENKRLR